MKLYGSTTSPYVRRVRILCLTLERPFELVDTTTVSGQAELRQKSAVWKVPAAELDGQLILDSHVIHDELLHGERGPFRPSSSWSVQEKNRMNVLDTALDSLIQRFYLAQEGVSAEVPWMAKQLARAESALAHLEATWPPGSPVVDSFTLALATALDWIQFRDACPLSVCPRLLALTRELDQLPAFAATLPG